ncbi:hypothetical protein R1flu_010660 [Riccia fluitans]|uniref:Peptidase S1 domain-containing protein n=1 Tax=Riccia fluitans TaxID=41844 RepID=A0ABD1Z5R8_9MARC
MTPSTHLVIPSFDPPTLYSWAPPVYHCLRCSPQEDRFSSAKSLKVKVANFLLPPVLEENNRRQRLELAGYLTGWGINDHDTLPSPFPLVGIGDWTLFLRSNRDDDLIGTWNL